MININMKILVLLRGQPRANANLYHENLKALDEWDADVDVILDGVTDMYTVTGKMPDNYMRHFAPHELVNTDGFHKNRTTILTNIKFANEWPTKTKIKVARLRTLDDGLRCLTENGLLRFIKEETGDMDEFTSTNSYPNIIGQYLWFFDPPVDYSKYDLLLTVRQDHILRKNFNVTQIDITKFMFITDGEHTEDGATTGYQDNILGFTQPGKIHEILDIINNSDVWEDDWYWNEGDGEGPYSVKGISWTLQLFRYQKTNHKLMLGISRLLAGIHNKIYIEPKDKFLFSLLPLPDITHGRTKDDNPILFDYYYDEKRNQKYKFYKK